MNLLKRLGSLPGRLIQFWKAPYPFRDAQEQRRITLLRSILRVMMGASALVFLVIFLNPASGFVFTIALSLIIAITLSTIWLKRGNIRAAGLTVVAGMVVILSAAAYLGNGMLSAPYMGLGVTILLAGLLLGSTAAWVTAAVASAVGLMILISSNLGLTPTQLLPSSINAYWFASVLVFLALAGVINLVGNNLRLSLIEAGRNQLAQAASLEELTQIRASLEDQVSSRTAELEQRTAYLQGIIEVTQTTGAMLDSSRLINTAVNLIQEQFNLYYASIFLIDLSGEWAILRAGSGEAGAAMLKRRHRIRLGTGMVGWCIANAQPRVAGDVLQDALRVVNPELPDTRSEAAIPLRSRGRVMGALSVQSNRPDAFGELEIATFQALADQTAVSLDNARLYEESRRALEEARRAYGEAAQRSWRETLRQSETLNLAYRYGSTDIHPIPLPPENAQAAGGSRRQAASRRAQAANAPVQLIEDERAILFLPIPVRETSIGVISFAKEWEPGAAPDRWNEGEISLLQSVVGQMGAALDSARLFQTTQQAALREQLTGEVTGRIRQTLDIQTVLRTAVQEIQRTLSLPEVVISLSAPEDVGEAN